MSGVDLDARIHAYASLFHGLTSARVDELEPFFTPKARFRDPFNDVIGWPSIRAIFTHMYRVCPEPGFEVLEWARTGNVAFIHWRFTNGPPGRRMSLNVEGLSRVEFDQSGRVVSHMDYWDPAAGIYERIPLIGALVRWLRRRISAG